MALQPYPVERRRSIALLAGLFFLVYVLVYAGALVAAHCRLMPTSTHCCRSPGSIFSSGSFCDGRHGALDVIAYFFHQNMIDAITGGEEVERKNEPRLYKSSGNLCISRGITTPKLKIIIIPTRLMPSPQG